jgi:hypothetical protein
MSMSTAKYPIQNGKETDMKCFIEYFYVFIPDQRDNVTRLELSESDINQRPLVTKVAFDVKNS